MLWFMILIPATAIVAGGYIVLVQSRLTEGALRTFGKYLAIWILVLGGVYFAGATTAAMYRGVSHGTMMHGSGHMRGMMGHGMMGERGTMQRGHMMDRHGMMGRDQTHTPASPEAPPTPPPAVK